MNKSYEEYLESFNILNKKDFNKLMEILPDFDINFKNIDWDFAEGITDSCECIINEILREWPACYCEYVDVDNKTFSVQDIQSLQDLKEIKEAFEKWTIYNYNDIKEFLEEEEENYKQGKIYSRKRQLMECLIEKLSLEELEKLVRKYDE